MASPVDLRAALTEYAARQFDAEPERLWADSPDAAVLRRKDNRRWFALFMRAPVGRNGTGADAVNVKCDPILIGSLRRCEGFFPAYHMNKQHWITVLLDGTVPLDQLRDLLALSYSLAGGKAKKTK